VELEALALGVRGKLALWGTLELLVPDRPELERFELSHLIARAQRQLDEIEAYRLQAAAEALGGERGQASDPGSR
jgi:hypothetical protein